MLEDIGYFSLSMRCDELKVVEEVAIPTGYKLQYYEAGDETKWLDIHTKADTRNAARAGLFRSEFGDNDHVLAWRQIYLYNPENVAVGTITAWYDDVEFLGPYWGRLHWLALEPDYHSKRLGELLVAACLQSLRQLGHRKAYLYTDSKRIPAINLYLKHGFRPEVRTLEDEENWRQLAPHLKYPSFP